MADKADEKWVLETHTCAECGAKNKLHKQKPEWLDGQDVLWECNECNATNVIEGINKPNPLDLVVECGECSATYDNREGSPQVSIGEDGTWTCPSCDTRNRIVDGGESAKVQQKTVVKK